MMNKQDLKKWLQDVNLNKQDRADARQEAVEKVQRAIKNRVLKAVKKGQTNPNNRPKKDEKGGGRTPKMVIKTIIKLIKRGITVVPMIVIDNEF